MRICISLPSHTLVCTQPPPFERFFHIATTDGGSSWKRLPDPPLARLLRFTSSRNGWMIGGSQGDQGIQAADDDAVWATHDGGEHWQQIALPPPRGLRQGDIHFSALTFADDLRGIVLGEVPAPEGQRLSFAWATHDGGKTWKLSRLGDNVETESIVGEQIAAIIRDRSSGTWTIRRGSSSVTTNLAPLLPSRPWFVSFDFVGDGNAWLNVYEVLLSTKDRGESFRSILPSITEPEWLPSVPHQ